MASQYGEDIAVLKEQMKDVKSTQEFFGTAGQTLYAYASVETTPTTPSKTYNVGWTDNASGALSYAANSTSPAYIKVRLA